MGVGSIIPLRALPPRDFSNFARGLVARGYSDQEVEGILGGNFLRVFEALLTL